MLRTVAYQNKGESEAIDRKCFHGTGEIRVDELEGLVGGGGVGLEHFTLVLSGNTAITGPVRFGSIQLDSEERRGVCPHSLDSVPIQVTQAIMPQPDGKVFHRVEMMLLLRG